MADDDLSAPLGRAAKTKRLGFKLPPNLLSYGLTAVPALFICAYAGWAIMVSDPIGGEPSVMVATGLGPAKPGAASPAGAPMSGQGGGQASTQSPRSYDGPGNAGALPPQTQTTAAPAQPADAPPAGGSRNTVTIIDGSTGKRQEVAIPASAAGETRAPAEQRLLEPSRHGAIPRVTPDGVRPAEAYAKPLSPAALKKNGPRVAIVLTGLGVSSTLTQQAIERLPGPVTLAFMPYGADVESSVLRARTQGHEILLQAPMEPFDYPDNDPGPQTLLASMTADQNMDRLYWLMSRFQGYVGLVNYMGARFTSTEQALAPIMRETARRGLIFVDDGASARSLASQIASVNNVPFAKSEIALDAVPTVAQIDRALIRLEAAAREHGFAVGVATAMPTSIERIALWAKTAEGRGVVLVPITAVALKPKSS
ncbi:divergent polysaccharide deacetylase family protein [Rhodoplanes sp. Z2-YC6860]|uniref:divergent polysaccharide deacetylase family protein n=1 Tax=Rhodoplanes sp. Z2-YC6860 TaxID=674703 RepID=UPI00078C3248|nr:divergent polysaccharide deacetylase family protein [Rhodoplanes sp. Z2-YC6860]AMN38994.1 divergent polysaccharide deacetylase [Rhodoplanes sp. Z2-YC6860]